MSQQPVDLSGPRGSDGPQPGTSGAHALSSASSAASSPSVLTTPNTTETSPISHSEQVFIGETNSAIAAKGAPGNLFDPSFSPFPIPADTLTNISSTDAHLSDAPNHPPNHPSMLSTNVRQRVRHSFDVFADQILSLRDIALKRELYSGLHTRLGDLVQEALDQFITRETEEAQRAIEARSKHGEQNQQAEPREWGQEGERATAASADEHEESQGSQEPHT